MLPVGKLTNRGEVSAQDHKLVSGGARIEIQVSDSKVQALPTLSISLGLALGSSQGSLEPLALHDSYQVMRAEFLEYSIVFILINFPLVINPVVEEAIKMSKTALAGLA